MKNIALALCLLFAGCAYDSSGRPTLPTPQRIADMTDEEFASWIQRVEAWSYAAGYEVVDDHPERFEHVVAFNTALLALTGQGSIPTDFLKVAAEKAGLSGPIVQILIVEAQQLLVGRGVIPPGPRGGTLVAAITAAVQRGADEARAGG